MWFTIKGGLCLLLDITNLFVTARMFSKLSCFALQQFKKVRATAIGVANMLTFKVTICLPVLR